MSAHTTGLGLATNYSLFAVPAGWVIANAPLYWAIWYASSKTDGAYDNANPAQGWKALEQKLPKEEYGKVSRAVAANNNSHVNLPLFAAGLSAAHLARVDVKTLNIAAGAYIVARTGYNFAYVLIDDGPLSWIRTICYWTGVGATLTLFVKAADRFKAVSW